ncbi:hypothetical protein ACIQAC_03130 [Streptomyces sp. NPDC088387]|uniref:hypothetical protein n=1 Tax=Streptomyces sp. NPDC088387 TaxID=3365859 RepID=UPI0037F91FAA
MNTSRFTWARRALCRFAMHAYHLVTPEELGHPTDPCAAEWRCAHCDRLWGAEQQHAYGHYVRRDDPCLQVATCERCGDEKSLPAHAHRRVAVNTIPRSEHPVEVTVHHKVHGASHCDYLWICKECGHIDGHVRVEHDWDKPRWGTCRLCREKWTDDGE